MGEFKERTGKTRVGSFLQKAGEVFPDVLKVAGGLTGIDALETVANVLGGNKSDENAQELAIEAFEILSLEYKDRDSARKREVERLKATGGKADVLMIATGVIVLLLVVLTVCAVFFFELANKEMAHFIAGEIMGLGSGMIMYYFGSSKGSKDKQNKIDALKG